MRKKIVHQKSKLSVDALIPPPIPPLLATIPQAAKILATTKWQVRTLLWNDKLPHIKLGKRHLIPVAALQGFVQQQQAVRQ